MRALLAELRPPAPQPTGRELLEIKGLIAALEAHLSGTSDESTPVALDSSRYRPAAFATEHALYRIAQEAVANARKHAKAQQIFVTLATRRGGTTVLTVQDDGIGFDTSALASPRPDGTGMGLSSMRERVDKLGGVLKMSSTPGRGTKVEVRVV
jgi:signal transduction histidine kinase